MILPVRFLNLKYVLFSLLVVFFILQLAVSGISNLSPIYFIIKAIISGLLLIFIAVFLFNSENPIGKIFSGREFKQVYMLISIIIIYSAITILYSLNPTYGTLKIMNFIVSVVPLILSAFVLTKIKWDNELTSITIIIISSAIVIVLISVLILQPFDQTTIYHYESGRWSHVFVGRLTGFLTIILFLAFINFQSRKAILLLSLIVIAGLFLLYLTGLRSAIIGISITLSLVTLYWFFKRRFNKHHLTGIYTILFVMVILVYVTSSIVVPESNKTPERMKNLLKLEEKGFGGDWALISRYDSYKLAIKMFNESTFLGNGIGSFNGYDDLEWTRIQKYPHNFILEILAEYGIIGILFFGWIFYLVFKGIIGNKDFSPPIKQSLLISLLFSFWLAMFSKDLFSQGFLWIHLAFVQSNFSGLLKK